MQRSPHAAQVAIVGGGLAGLATAWGLVERGVTDVVVLERGPALAAQASGRNAAMCRALAEDDAWTTLTAAGAALLRSPPPDLAGGSLVDGRGLALLSRSAEARAVLGARAARHGVRCEPLDPARLAAWAGLADAEGLWFPDDGVIDLGGLVAGLTRAAQRAGVRLMCDAEVEAATPSADGAVELMTAAGVVRARVVVDAAGAWVGEVAGRCGAADPGYQVRRRHVFALATAAPDAPIVWDVDEREWYLRPAGAEVWASACDSELAAPGDVMPVTTAEAVLRDRLPTSAAGARLAQVWACQRTFAPGGSPVIARDDARPWLCFVAGLGGHGVTASLAVGRQAAAVVLTALADR